MTHPTTSARPTRNARPFSPARLSIAGGVAGIATLVVYWIGSASGAAMVVTSPSTTEIPAWLALFATVSSIAAAGVVTWFIARRRPRFRSIAAWLGLAVAVVSVPSPLLVAEDTATGVSLAAMHLIAGIAWFIGLHAPAAPAVTAVPAR